MTLEEFVATRAECGDIGAAIQDSRWDGGPKAKGYLYCGSFYIEQVQPDWPERARAAGRWYLTLERDEYITNDLPDLERKLYEFAYAHPLVSSVLKANAVQHKGSAYGFDDDITFDGLKQYISDHGPVILLMRLGSEFWTAPNGQASWAENDILPLRTPRTIVSGHFVVAHSYDERYIYFINSFGPTWGREGHGYFGASYMPYVVEAGALIDLAFAKNLSKGMAGPDVLRLQRTLNADPDTRVASSGAGAPGHETEFFGALTLSAVLRFQKKHGVPATGFVGPLTRAALQLLVK